MPLHIWLYDQVKLKLEALQEEEKEAEEEEAEEEKYDPIFPLIFAVTTTALAVTKTALVVRGTQHAEVHPAVKQSATSAAVA